jgi:hypothetical protein
VVTRKARLLTDWVGWGARFFVPGNRVLVFSIVLILDLILFDFLPEGNYL